MIHRSKKKLYYEEIMSNILPLNLNTYLEKHGVYRDLARNLVTILANLHQKNYTSGNNNMATNFLRDQQLLVTMLDIQCLIVTSKQALRHSEDYPPLFKIYSPIKK